MAVVPERGRRRRRLLLTLSCGARSRHARRSAVEVRDACAADLHVCRAGPMIDCLGCKLRLSSKRMHDALLQLAGFAYMHVWQNTTS